MDFGLFSESGHRLNPRAADAYDEDLAEVILGDQLGMTEAWIAEPNHVRPNTVTHAYFLMARAAAVTDRIRFGSGIRQLPLHHPVDVAQEANAIDNVTHGRYIFGYGGTHLVTHEQLQMRGIEVEREETRAMVYESVEFLLRCFTETEPFDFDGRYWQGRNVHILPRPYQQPHIPIAAGCSGSTETLELAARHGFAPLLGRGTDSAEELRSWGDTYLSAAAAAGQPASRKQFRVAHVAYVGESDSRAREEVYEGLCQLIEDRKKEPVYLLRRIDPGMTLDDVTFDYMLESGFYWVGGPDTIYQRIKDFYDGSGGFGTLLMFCGLPIAPPEKIADSMHRLMEQVAPRLAHLDPDESPAVSGSPAS
ncbi:MAG TPA: LLM class flavin-dependent oxidoreductase [Chloroflexota bacterium]|nr:LLM class flavin-dependent oxidoreductase [Chloroflexota bacterium]